MNLIQFIVLLFIISQGSLATKASFAMPRGRSSFGGGARRAATPRRSSTSSVRKPAAASRAPPKKAPTSSRRSTGLYTAQGKPIYNAQAYTEAGGKTFNRQGRYIHHGVAYATKVQQTSIAKVAKTVTKQNPRAKAFSYTLQAADGKCYAGYTTNPARRMQQHLTGNGGAVATKQMDITRVQLRAHRSAKAAKAAETRLYFQAKEKKGIDNVRGAGHTKKFH